MEKKHKSATTVALPIRVGERVKFYNDQNQLCESRICSIDKIRINYNALFITFSTRNSIYTNVKAEIPNQGIVQEMSSGTLISMGGTDRAVLNILYEINQQGIIAGTNDKKWIFGEFSNPQSKV